MPGKIVLEPYPHPCAVCGDEVRTFKSICEQPVCARSAAHTRLLVRKAERREAGRCVECGAPSEPDLCRPCWVRKRRATRRKSEGARKRAAQRAAVAAAKQRRLEAEAVNMERIALGLPVSRAKRPVVPQHVIPETEA
jgi:hypothetical protein